VIRLVLPLAGIVTFFVLSLATVRLLKPKQPRVFFLAFAVALLPVTAWVYVTWWPMTRTEDAAGLMACLLLQVLLCVTFWNSFYSLLWGFSGGLVHDLHNDPSLRHAAALIRSYEGGETGTDRIMARRLPNLIAGGYIVRAGETLRLRPKGRAIAIGTLFAFRVFSLGMGGGVK
jgi:hypothetical protein